MSMRLSTAILAVAVLLLGGCDSRPTLHVVTTPGAPATPEDAAFALLPSRDEMLLTFNQVYENLEPEIELPTPLSGDVHWNAVAKNEWGHPGYWVYLPKSRMVGDAVSSVFTTAKQLRVDSLRWRYDEGKWQFDGMFRGSHEITYGGIDDPDEAQVIALLQQPGIQYAFHSFGTVPDKIRLLRPVQSTRDAEGFSELRFPVEFTAQTEIVDFPSNQLHLTEVTVRAVIYCDVIDGKWRTEREVKLLASKRLSSRAASDEELFKHHWAMDAWWRNH
jgi:hypothetical protein